MKNLTKVLSILFITVFLLGGIKAKAYVQPSQQINYLSILHPQSDIIEWRYKVENGKMYKRQYNCTKDKRIGNWKLIS